MALKRTGYTKSTPKHYLLDAGAVYMNLKFADGEWTGDLLGATAEGNTLTIEPEYRQIEVDGPKVAVKGGRALESILASLEVNVKELTAENYRRSINGQIRDAEEGEAPSGYKVIESKPYIEDDDYEENIAYVGTLSGTKEPFIAILDNPFVTSASESEFQDDQEAVVAMTFEASANPEDIEDQKLPWRIFYPDVNKEPAPEPDPEPAQ